MIDVEPVSGRGDLDAFIELPFRLRRGDSRWVPPLRREQRRSLLSHPLFEFGAVQLFVAHRYGRVVGRVAAVDNPRHNEVHGGHDGFFGLFECVDDPAVAEALFGTVDRWLAARGLDTVLGPVGFSTNYECGMLVEGFDRPPMLFTAYNPDHYPVLVEKCGFTPAKDLWAWEVPPVAPPPRVARLVEVVRRDKGITVRRLDPHDMTAEITRLKALYNSAWEDNWGFVPMTDRKFEHLAAQLKPILRPALCLFAEARGEPVGFTLMVPDANEALRRAGGRMDPLSLWRVARALPSVSGARLIALGVDRSHRGRGVDTLLYTELMAACRELSYRTWEASWTLEDNHAVDNAIRLVGGQRTKVYRIYRRTL